MLVWFTSRAYNIRVHSTSQDHKSVSISSMILFTAMLKNVIHRIKRRMKNNMEFLACYYSIKSLNLKTKRISAKTKNGVKVLHIQEK